MLNHTDDRFLEELNKHVPHPIYVEHTGGGVMVTVIDLSIDARGLGPQVWITREDDWLIGFYDFAQDPEDEGECLSLMTMLVGRDNAEYVAKKIARVLAFFRRAFVQLDYEQRGGHHLDENTPTVNIVATNAAAIDELEELRAWLDNEVEAGDDAISVWRDKLDATLAYVKSRLG